MKAVAGDKVLLLVKRGEMSQFAVIDLTRG
jgi:hypothetical protein